MKTYDRPLLCAALAAGLALSGCFGGSDADFDDPQAAANVVPDSALTTSAAFTAYVGSLPLSETAAPVDIDKITTAPSSDTEAPMTL